MKIDHQDHVQVLPSEILSSVVEDNAMLDINSAGREPDALDTRSDSPARNWYVIRTEPRAEQKASAELERAGLEVYSPRITSMNARGGYAETPLFPGYLFLRCDLAEDAPTFKQVAPHVSGWVDFDGIVPSLPNEFVDSLHRRLANIDDQGGLWRRFHRGEKVRVMAGNVQELAEVLEEPKSPQARVRVLMEFMGRLVPAQVPWESLSPAEEEQVSNNRVPRRTRGKGRWIEGFGQRAIPVTGTL